jgi:hypothetical protein
MANCLDDKDWSSKVPKDASKEKGKFKITKEYSNGDFEGRFKDDSGPTEDIRGNCSAATIWFLKPAHDPSFLYSGTFLYVGSEKRFIEGTREPVSVELADGKRSRKLAGDEWEADKIT